MLIVENPAAAWSSLVRNGAEVNGYNAACTHMGTTVERPQGRCRHLPEPRQPVRHRHRRRQEGPATKPLQTVAVKVDGDQVVLA